MWLWRKIEGIIWQDHITNEEVLNKVGEKRSLINTITRRKKNLIGQVLGGNNLLQELIEGRLYGKRRKGKPRQQILNFIMGRKTCVEMKRLAQDRKSWRKQNHRLEHLMMMLIMYVRMYMHVCVFKKRVHTCANASACECVCVHTHI